MTVKIKHLNGMISIEPMVRQRSVRTSREYMMAFHFELEVMNETVANKGMKLAGCLGLLALDLTEASELEIDSMPAVFHNFRA